MIGIVVLNYRTWKLSKRCMESICRTCSERTYRIYFVDNGSENPMPDFITQFLKRKEDVIRLIQVKKNRGYAAGNNLGMIKALEDGCSVIVIANNDIVFEHYAVFRMADSLKKHPGTGIVGPKVVNEKGETQISHCSMRTGMKEIFQLYTAAKWIFRKKWKLYSCLNQKMEAPMYVYHVSGCCFAISKECAKEVMPLDEKTMLYNEELILGIRMEQAGFRTRYEPDSVVVHRHGATTKKVRPFMYQCMSQSELYYCAKYQNAKGWQLWLLYHYRRILYMLRCISDKQMRSYRKAFRKNTAHTYKSIKMDRLKEREKINHTK